MKESDRVLILDKPIEQMYKDEICADWLNSLKPGTAATYKNGLRWFCKYAGKMPSTLVSEAREDYLNRVAPWELRHIRLIEGMVASLDDDIANWTKLGIIKAVKNFYKFYKIPVIGLNHCNIPLMATEDYLDTPVLKIEDIRKAVQICGTNKLLKALILTFLSSGQGQAEVQRLKGRHLRNIVNGIAVVNMTRSKTNTRYTFFIGPEALEAIKDYKPNLRDDEYIFTQQKKDKPLNDSLVDSMFSRHASKMEFSRRYFAPHRFRHFFKTQLTGIVDSRFVEYWMGHKLTGVESNYFIGAGIQERMLQTYIKNLNLLTVSTDREILQKRYDELKQKRETEKENLKKGYDELKNQMEFIVMALQAKGANEDIGRLRQAVSEPEREPTTAGLGTRDLARSRGKSQHIIQEKSGSSQIEGRA